MSSCATITRPSSGFRNPMMWCSDTDFPTPLRPRIQIVSPADTAKLTSCNTHLSPNDLLTCSNRIYGGDFDSSAISSVLAAQVITRGGEGIFFASFARFFSRSLRLEPCLTPCPEPKMFLRDLRDFSPRPLHFKISLPACNCQLGTRDTALSTAYFASLRGFLRALCG